MKKVTITKLQIPNLKKDLRFKLAIKNTFKNTDTEAGHGISGTHHSDPLLLLRRLHGATLLWNKTVAAIAARPNSGSTRLLYLWLSLVQDKEKAMETRVREVR